MATGGVSVDAGRNKWCSVCEDGGQQIIANYFCIVCEQNLCDTCKNFHSKVRTTKSHEVIRIDEIPLLTSLTLDSESTELPVCKAHGKEIKYFCTKDMVEICGTCKLIEHKPCQNIMDIEKAAADVFSEDHGKKILESIKDLLNKFSLYRKVFTNNRSKLEQDKNSAVENIKDTRRSIDSYLDKLETAEYEEIESVFQVNVKDLEDQMHVCEVSVSSLQKQVSSLERAISVGEKEQEFITINNATKEIITYSKLFQDILAGPCDINISFRQNDNIASLNEHLRSLGKVSVHKYRAPSDTVAIYTGEIKVNTETDTVEAGVSSYETLPDGRHLLVDTENKKLKLFDTNKHLLSELVLLGQPISVVLLRDAEAVISLPWMRALQYVRINKGLEQIETRKLDYKPGPMVKYGEDIIAFTGRHIIEVIDKHGKIKQTIYKDDGSLFTRPESLALSTDQETVYVTDQKNGCVGISLNGTIAFRYQDQKIKLYSGLAVRDDSLFIYADGDVIRIDLNGAVEVIDIKKELPLKLKGNELWTYTWDYKGVCTCANYFVLR